MPCPSEAPRAPAPAGYMYTPTGGPCGAVRLVAAPPIGMQVQTNYVPPPAAGWAWIGQRYPMLPFIAFTSVLAGAAGAHSKSRLGGAAVGAGVGAGTYVLLSHLMRGFQ